MFRDVCPDGMRTGKEDPHGAASPGNPRIADAIGEGIVDKQTGERLIAEGKTLVIAELQLPGPMIKRSGYAEERRWCKGSSAVRC